jgi:hypothetical protein
MEGKLKIDVAVVILYTAVGGLKATFITDFLHTTVALILIIYFTLSILTNPHVGGIGGLYDKVMATAAENYIPGNYEGSLLTMKSENAIIWGLILKFGNLALVVMVGFRRTLYASSLTSSGHCILAKVLCDKSQCNSSGIQFGCAGGFRYPMGFGDGHWVGCQSPTSYPDLP